MCSSAARAVRSGFCPSGPLRGGEGWTKRPAGESARMPIPFRRGRSPVEKPGRPSRTGRLHRPAPSGGALLFGYFLLGKQEKVTRPPAGGRKPAAGEPGRHIAKTKSQKPKTKSQKPKTKSQKPKAKSQKPKAKSQKPKAKSQKPKAKSQSHWTPAFAGVTAKERRGEAGLFTPLLATQSRSYPWPLPAHPSGGKQQNRAARPQQRHTTIPHQNHPPSTPHGASSPPPTGPRRRRP